MKKYLLFVASVGTIALGNTADAQSAKNQPELSNGSIVVSESSEQQKSTSSEPANSSSITSEESLKRESAKDKRKGKSTTPELGVAGSKNDALIEVD